MKAADQILFYSTLLHHAPERVKFYIALLCFWTFINSYSQRYHGCSNTPIKVLTQPAIKVRGKEYLRIIYGPAYDSPDHISRLIARGLSAKRSLALREFALGIEGLQRFVNKEPLRRVHECVFGVLAPGK